MTQMARARESVCPERQRLADAFVAAVQQLMKLQDEQMAQLAGGGEGLARFDLALEAAHRRREETKEAYAVHIQHHDCWGLAATALSKPYSRHAPE